MSKSETAMLVLAIPLEFCEGGFKMRTYPAGTRVPDLSDDALAWLEKNKDQPEISDLLESREMSDDEIKELTAEIDNAQRELDEATEAMAEAAAAIVAAKDAIGQREASGANAVAASALQVIQKKYDVLVAGGVEQYAEKRRAADQAAADKADLEARRKDILAAHKAAASAHKRAVKASKAAETDEDVEAAQIVEDEALVTLQAAQVDKDKLDG